MIEAPLALAFAAGLVATVNPCGFAMLPAYLSYFIGLNEVEQGRGAALRSALKVGSIVSLGFLFVFGVAGILITAGFRAVIDFIPWLALIVGFGIVALGMAMLLGHQVTVGLPKSKRAVAGRGYRSVFLFGISYAVASLSCTLPVFLTVVAAQVTRGSFISGVATFLAYGLGMSLLLVGITIALAAGKQRLVSWLRGSVRYVNRVSGLILTAAGAYIIWFWGTNIASGAQALGEAGPFRFVESLSQWAIGAIGENALFWGVALAGAILVGGFLLFRSSSESEDEDAPMDVGTSA